jgi:hypothetical protein
MDMGGERSVDDPRLSEEQRETIKALASPTGNKGKSKVSILRSLPTKQKITYFMQYFFWKIVVVLAALAAVSLLVYHVASPSPKPLLYVAAVDISTDDARARKLSASFQKGLASQERIAHTASPVQIDTYFNLQEDGLSKLQTMLRNNSIDIILAPESVFEELAGFGYLQPGMSHYATKTAKAYSCAGYDDSKDENPNYNGSGKGEKEDFGLILPDSSPLDGLAASEPTEEPVVIGIAQETQELKNAHYFIDYAIDGKITPREN